MFIKMTESEREDGGVDVRVGGIISFLCKIGGL